MKQNMYEVFLNVQGAKKHNHNLQDAFLCAVEELLYLTYLLILAKKKNFLLFWQEEIHNHL
jgi:hypothetical protein